MTTSVASARAASVGAVRGEGGLLWPLLDDARRLHRAWEHSRLEEDRLAMLDAWHIHITCTGALDPDLRPWGRCTPTVLVRDTGDKDNHMAFRGACLGCGWVAQAVHGIWTGGENAAAEGANDHTHPAWRTLPVIGRPPRSDSAVAARRAVQAWRARWEPILPPGWLEAGGPIRTRRGVGTRHVPEACPGGGYDMCADHTDDGHPEAAGGQLELFA